MIRHRDGFHLSLSVFSCFSGLLEMEAASVVIRAAEAVALAEEMEALDPLRTVLEPGQATEADEPLTLGSAQSPLMILITKIEFYFGGKVVQILCFLFCSLKIDT